MTELSVLERVRAAVAEAGYDPTAIVAPFDDETSFAYLRSAIPTDVAWRAREAALIDDPLCFACVVGNAGSAALPPIRIPPCLADRRFVEDCGRERVEP